MSEETIHSAAREGYAVAAGDYVRGRPDYPPEIGTWLTCEAGLRAGKSVLDLGAGTGKFLPLLLETGATVHAVEPVDAMRGELERRFPGVDARSGTASAIPLPDASLDATACAQAFHWFATREALDEMARVLRPGGKVVLIWNMRDARVPWVAALDAIVNTHEGEAPRFHAGTWRSAFPHPGFGPLREWQFPHRHTGPVEEVIRRRVLSTSFIASLEPARKAEVMAEVDALVAQTPALQGGGEVSVPYVTHVFMTCAR